MRRARIAALLLPALCGCGFFLEQPIGKDARGFDVSVEDRQPAHTLLVEGDVRDSLSFRPEPRAAIEVWTDDPGYAPKVTVDDRGQFSVRIDVCRREKTAGEEFTGYAVLGSLSDRCARWLGRFRFRARLGDRCSVTYGDDSLPKDRKPFVLWLRPCDEAELARGPQPLAR